jgi:para-nitrobenzyl esterase
MDNVGARRWPRGTAALAHLTALAFVVLASIPAARRGLTLDAPVRVAGGLVSGAPGRDASITVFKGVPFAAPPVGDLRWRAPGPVVAWTGVKKADQFGANCMQTIVDEKKPWTYEFMAHGPVSEDCLFLNVWTGATSAAEKRPVYVYVHGGANTEGSGSVPAYDGEGLARKGIVVVTVNYRLGVLGFFTHPGLTKESAAHASGNYALLDLIAALRWVREHIAAFGGDPANVTLGGQSAGASNTHSLVASPLARGLFHRAIAESGSGIAAGRNARTLADQERLGIEFAQAKAAPTIAALRAMSWQDLTAPVPPTSGTPPPAGGFRFGVVVDGHVLLASPLDAFTAGTQQDVPTLTGANRHENGATPHPDVTAAAFQAQARQRYGDLAAEFLSLYPAATDAEARTSQNESAWDQARVSMHLWAMHRAATARTPVFTYFWDHPLPGPDVETYGAFHTSEVPYVMNTLAMSRRPFVDDDRRIADRLSTYFANFMKTGDPNGPGLPTWPAAAKDPALTMQVGDTFAPISVATSVARLAFFQKHLARQRAAGSR